MVTMHEKWREKRMRQSGKGNPYLTGSKMWAQILLKTY